MTLNIAQHAVPQGSSSWIWSVWIEGTEEELDNVQEVIWRLHPSFSQPIHRVSSRATRFKLRTSGWGEFEIHAQIDHKNGQSESISHWLRLKENAANEAAPQPKSGKGSKPTVFLSYPLNYADVAAHLSKALKKGRYGVIRDVDIPAGEQYTSWTKDQITKSDAVIVLGADDISMWPSLEIETAQSAGVPVLPVTFGSKILPSKLREIEPLRVKTGSPDKVALNLVHQIGKLLL